MRDDLKIRPRRLRENSILRDMIRETRLDPAQFVMPVFVTGGSGVCEEMSAMPGIFHLSVDCLDGELEAVRKNGVRSILLFGVPDTKNAQGSSAWDESGVVQKAVRYIKSNYDFLVITDVCLCAYTDHGHCGIVDEEGRVLNDETLELLSRVAVSHAQAGADMVAPSDMMDGRVGSIRKSLDEAGYSHIPIMSYSTKYASAFYGPFREAAHSAPSFGDRKTYQMDYHNAGTASLESALDMEEGADILMVKPAMPYLDILKTVKTETNLPVAAYQVSGEYALLKNGITRGLVGEEAAYEALVAIKRAGADIIISYFGKEIKQLIGKFG